MEKENKQPRDSKGRFGKKADSNAPQYDELLKQVKELQEKNATLNKALADINDVCNQVGNARASLIRENDELRKDYEKLRKRAEKLFEILQGYVLKYVACRRMAMWLYNHAGYFTRKRFDFRFSGFTEFLKEDNDE